MALVLQQLSFVLTTLEKAGFVISEEKTDTEESVSQVKVYLGFVIDSVNMTLGVTTEKIKDIRKAIWEGIGIAGPQKTRAIDRSIGKVVAAEPAFGPVV